MSRDDEQRWQAPRNDAGRKQLRRRIVEQLDAQVDAEFAPLEANYIEYQRQLTPEFHEQVEKWLTHRSSPKEKMRRAMAAFRQGRVEPVREVVREICPELEPAINLPTLRRGEHFEKPKPESPARSPIGDLGLRLTLLAQGVDYLVQHVDPHFRLEAAVADARRIRDIRQRHFDGKRNGPFGGLTAEGIAADRWGLSESEVRDKRLSRGTLKRVVRGR